MEHFLLNLQAKRVYKDEEDRAIRMVSKSGKFSIKFLYLVLEPSVIVPGEHHLEFLHATQGGFFCLGGDLRKSL